MSSTTPQHEVPYPDPTDSIAMGDDVLRQLAERVDYLLGENHDVVIVGDGSSDTAVASVVYDRNYTAKPFTVVSTNRKLVHANTFNETATGCDVRVSDPGGVLNATVTVSLAVRPVS